MSPKNSLLIAGLAALGVFGYAASRAAVPGDPAAPPGPTPAPATSSPSLSVLLLSNGRVIRGQVTPADDGYLVRQNGGEIRFRKDQVEEVFGSLDAVYRYKLAQVPERDPDEHLKLARWCLSQNMPAEAKAHLQAVVALSPTATEAKAMLNSVEATEARATRPDVDSGLVRTRAEAVEPGPGADARPAEISPDVLRRAQRELGVTGLPVIFDLPPSVAVRRATQFARVVHPVLQASCAKCHNEQHEGKFQLVEVKSRRDLTADVFRANLDATLLLINPDNPAKSELLSSALVPHGQGANKRPIFRGSNDPRFQVLAAWVQSLRSTSPRSPDGAVPTRFNAARDDPGGGFASERERLPAPRPAAAPKLVTPMDFGPPKAGPSARYVPGQGMVTESSPPSPEEFPLPPMLGGPRPKLNPAPAGGALPELPPTAGAEPGKPATPAKTKKPVKIDDALLQQMLINRNGSR